MVAGYRNSFFTEFIIKKRYQWIRHGLLIGALFSLFFITDNIIKLSVNEDKHMDMLIRISAFIILLALFYVNSCILIPKFVLKNRYLLYFSSLLVIYLFIFLGMVVVERYLIGAADAQFHNFLSCQDFIGLTIILSIFVATVSSIKLFKLWIIGLIRFKELENNTLKVELEQLKSQINPHFLFNTLNNINVLIDENPKLASDILLRLSDILRHQLYQFKGDQIHLCSDIQLLKSILYMESIRRDSFIVDFQVTEGVDQVEVPPFLFIPFIENAIKHGKHDKNISEFHVQVCFQIIGRNLHFSCVNPVKTTENKQDNGGIGLSNIQKRLNILYTDRYALNIENDGRIFEVKLQIPLAK